MTAAAKKGDRPQVGIIGGSGFIGTVLVSLLREDRYAVRILDIAKPPPSSAGVEYEYSDVTELSLLIETLKGCDILVNLAAAHRDDVRPLSKYHDVNVLGAENVCRAAESLGINTIVFTSSVAVYGFPHGEPDEESTPIPFNLYGKTKLQAEHIYREWQRQDGANRQLNVVRPTVVFGPGNRGNVYNLLKQLTHSRFVMIGRGRNRKSMAFVKNVAAFLAYLISSERQLCCNTYNYCDTPALSMWELVRLVRTTLDKPIEPFVTLPYSLGVLIGAMCDAAATFTRRSFPISKVRVQKFCASTVFSSARSRDTGFVPPYALDEALRDTIRYEFGAVSSAVVSSINSTAT